MEENKLNLYHKLFEIKKANIKLQRDTKAYNYKYATLSQIQEKLGEYFERLNLLVTHRIKDNKVITRITNLDDIETYIESEITMSEGIKPQDKGSEITYYRRYNLLALLDLEVEDDDGQKANNSNSGDKKKDEPKKWFNDAEFQQTKKSVENGNNYTLQDILDKGYSISTKMEKQLMDIGIF